jgi:tRNA A-37 threonylcarbamoyl transferase component Bud32
MVRPVATATVASSCSPAVRYCACCLAIYRQDFQRCPVDGATLVVGADPWLGLTVGVNYVLEHVIGEGAMGRVYGAHHRQFVDRRYAVKIMLGDLVAQAQMRARFALEAKLASRLSHPNVVGVIDYGVTERGVNHMVMELVEGPTLGAILRRAPIAPTRVIAIARQICEGLDHAHERGLVHRDLKPDNILVLNERGVEIPRIADFGLALSTHSDRRLTTTGVVCTPAYAAPEQLRGENIDHRVDLYALGVTMYEMLSGGGLPFDGDIDVSVKSKLANEAPSMRIVAPETPPALVAIVGRLLSSQPERRPRSARAVIRALDQALAAPRVAIKTDQTTRLRALTKPPPAGSPDSTGRVQIHVHSPRRGVRRAAVQLFACGVTLGAALAWADLRGDTTVRAEPVLQAVAEPATPPDGAAASIVETSELDVDVAAGSLRVVADDLAAPIVTPVADPPITDASVSADELWRAASRSISIPSELAGDAAALHCDSASCCVDDTEL